MGRVDNKTNIWLTTEPKVMYQAEHADMIPVGLIGLNIAVTNRTAETRGANREYHGPILIEATTLGEGVDAHTIWGIIDIIEASPRQVRMFCSGQAFNIGLGLFLSGHLRYCTRHTTFIYYNPVAKNRRWPVPWDADPPIPEAIAEEELLMDQLDAYIVERTNITVERLQEVRQAGTDWYIHAPEALELGIVTAIVDDVYVWQHETPPYETQTVEIDPIIPGPSEEDEF